MGLRVMALETAGDHIRAAVAERARESFRLSGTFEDARRPDEADLLPALVRLVAAAGKPDILISAIPGELVAHRMLTLPFKDARKLRQVVPFALEEHLPFPVDDGVSTFARIGQDADGTIVFAAIVRKSELRAHLDLLGKAGLDPKTVTLGALALARLLSRASEVERNGRGPCANLLLDIDQARTSLVLLDSTGAPRAMRMLPAGLQADGRTMAPPQVTATIVNAARQTLLAHGSDLEPPNLLIAGPAATNPAIKSEIGDGLATAVRDVSGLDGFAASEGFPRDWLRFGACIAMLLGEAPANSIDLLNFRQDEFAFRGRNLDAAPLYSTALLTAGMLALAVLHVIFATAIGVHRLNVLDGQIQTLAAPALGTRPASEVPGALRTGITTMRTQLALMGGGSTRTSPIDVLFALSRALPPKMPVAFSDLQIDASGIKVDGQADSFGTIDQVKKALSTSRYFDDIEVNDAKVENASGKVDFHLSAALEEGSSGR